MATNEERMQRMKTSPNMGLNDEVNINKSNDIIAKKGQKNKDTETDEIFKMMINSIPNDINLVKVLNAEIKDPLLKFKDGDGGISITKIPDNLYIVAIVHKLISIGKKQGWDLARESDFIYLYNGRYWTQCFKDDLYKFFKSIARK